MPLNVTLQILFAQVEVKIKDCKDIWFQNDVAQAI